MDNIARQELEEDLQAMYLNLLDEGYTQDEANVLIGDYAQRRNQIEEVKSFINLRRQLPLSEIEKLSFVCEKGGYKKLTKPEADYLMWNLGFDTKSYGYAKDIGYYVFNDRKYFGEFIVGQERSDKQWTSATINDVHVCSYEAILKQKGHFKLMSEITKLLAGH